MADGGAPKLPRAEDPNEDYLVSGETWNLLVDTINALYGGQAELRRSQTNHVVSFWARITGSATMASENNRWTYAWEEVLLDPDDSTTKTNGRSGTTSSNYAINTCEDANDNSGVQAPGIDIDGADYPAGFSMQPIQGDPVVRMFAFRSDDGGTIVHAFTMPNAHDGTCS